MAEPAIGSQFVLTSGGRIAAAVVQAVTYLIIARDAGPETFAVVALVVGLTTVLQSIFDLGVSTFVIRERARNESSIHVAHALILNRYTSAALAVTSLCAVLLAASIVDENYLLILPLIFWIGGERFIETRLGIAMADGRAGSVSKNLLIRRISSLVTYLGITAVGFGSLEAFSISFTIGTLLGAIHMVLGVRIRVVDQKVGSAGLRSVIRMSTPFWLNSTVTQLRNLDVLVVTAVTDYAVGGLYGIIARSIGPLRILSTSLSAVLLPAASRAHTMGLRSLRRPIANLSLCLVVFYGATAALIPLVVPVLLGSDYEDSILPMQVVVASLIFAAGSSILNSLLQAGEREWAVATVSSVTSVVILVACAFGAFYAGVLGAAVAVGAGFFLQFLILFFLFSKGVNRGQQDGV